MGLSALIFITSVLRLLSRLPILHALAGLRLTLVGIDWIHKKQTVLVISNDLRSSSDTISTSGPSQESMALYRSCKNVAILREHAPRCLRPPTL